MKKLRNINFVFGLLAVTVSICWSAPVSDDKEQVDSPLTNEDYLDNDMLFSFLRNGQVRPPKKWPNGIVYFKISPDFDSSQVANIKSAMTVIQALSCVRFRAASRKRKHFVHIKAENTGCNSEVGYFGRPQRMNLQKDASKCFMVPVIMHELMHTLGFFHQHMSPQRDDYIAIQWENIKPGAERWFGKLDNATFLDFGYGYDYNSIMHYSRTAFSGNRLDTILPLDSNAEIGQRLGLSIKDISKINAMYNCTMDT